MPSIGSFGNPGTGSIETGVRTPDSRLYDSRTLNPRPRTFVLSPITYHLTYPYQVTIVKTNKIVNLNYVTYTFMEILIRLEYYIHSARAKRKRYIGEERKRD